MGTYIPFAQTLLDQSGQMLGKDILHDVSFLDASESLVETLVREDELVVINSELVKHSCVKVAYVYRILYYIIAELVGFPIADTALDSATCHPCGKASWMMVATILFPISRIEVLGVRGPAKFARENDKRVIKQSSLLQIRQ